ncbi:hypothetical protein D9619_009888 [Psilocybe cf. subviscida]|uniref:Uncharacterized protein n=1 Tax=Psilocybe cf. subviscida TaxID=2480587 RepID=A0A8H5BLF1_9AGAR|nr:hypothetical protein D9619_009888 [Psilocybe cf. subviscida]
MHARMGTILAAISALTLVVLKLLAVFMSIISASKSVVVLVASFFAVVSKYLPVLRQMAADVKTIRGIVVFIVQVYQLLFTTPDGPPQNTDKRNETNKRETQPDEPSDGLDNGVAKESKRPVTHRE